MSSNALEVVSGDIYSCRDAFQQVLTEKSINFEAEANFAIQVLSANDYSLGIAKNNRQSVVDAVTNVAAIGLSLNPAYKHAYLVPRKHAICLDISYMGLIELAVASGSVVWAKAEIVCESDVFEMQTIGQPPIHKFHPFSRDRGEVIGVYCVAKIHNGDFLVGAMSTDEINAIRDRSDAWKKKQSGPWLTDWREMAKKSIIKRESKTWPKTDRLDKAIHYLNTDAGEGLAPESTGLMHEYDVNQWIKNAKACKTEDDLKKVYGEFMSMCAENKDKASAEKFKAEAKARRDRLREQNTVEMERSK